MLPKLMHERLPEMGIDFSVVYPTIGFLLPDIPDNDIRRAACRAHNLMMADMFHRYIRPSEVIAEQDRGARLARWFDTPN